MASSTRFSPAVAFSWWFLALYRRPARFLGLVLGVPLVVLCLWIYVVSERQWRAREGQDLLVTARLAARVLEEELGRAQAGQAAVASRPDFIQALAGRDHQALLRDLQILLGLTPRADRVLLRDLEGRVIAQITTEAALPHQDPVAWPEAGDPQPAVSGVYLRDAVSGEKVVSVATPVPNSRAPIGAVHTQYRLRDVARWLQRIRVEPAGFLYVVDHRGFLVAHPYQLLPGTPKDVSRWTPVLAAASAEGRLVRFRQTAPAHGRLVRPAKGWTAAVVAVPPYWWRVVAQQPDAAMLKPFYRLAQVFAAVVAALAGLLILVIARWARLHEATLGLLAKQSRLLALAERRLQTLKMRRGAHGPRNDAA